MPDLNKISEQMRREWDRRVAHDYRFWMSDGHQSDADMWAAGERDFEILTGDLEGLEDSTLLEVGCGVGRLLRPALKKLKSVIGIDVSTEAIAKAQSLLGQQPNLKLLVGNGVDLISIPNNSVDLVVSFAALSSMPVQVMASYLREIHGVLVPNGIFRAQVYIGEEQVVASDDTLHLRCFRRERFETGLKKAGFDLHSTKELNLPFQVSFKELGIEAVIVTLIKTESTPSSIDEIAGSLLPDGEAQRTESVAGADLEWWMSLNHAKELLDRGETERARKALEYARTHAQEVGTQVLELIAEIEERLSSKVSTVKTSQTAKPGADLLAKNMRVLEARFPEVVSTLKAVPKEGLVEVRDTEDGPVLFLDGQCLDHPSKPVSGGQAWAQRQLGEERIKDSNSIVVFGLGAGYHVEQLCELTNKAISVFEPSAAVLWKILEVRDLTCMFERLTALAVGSAAEDFFSSDAELVIRPQSQVSMGAICDRVKAQFYGTRGLKALAPKIAVIGPIQGGTLPIAAYTARALNEAKQRIRTFDFSGFAQGYDLIQEYVAKDNKKAVVSTNFVEMLSQTLLEAIDEKPIDLLICMAQAPISPRVLTELRKRGVITVMWFVEDYLRFGYWRSIAPFYDFIFTIQRGECLEAIRKAGCPQVHYLPTACDPVVHRPVQLSPEERARWGSPISFVGAGYHNRQQTFASLANLPFKIWGTEWPHCKPFDRMLQEEGRRLSPEEYIKIFNATDININLHSSMERDGVDPYGDFLNPRTFELASAAAFQLVDERQLLHESFEIGKEIVTFNSTTDLKDKIAYYLAHPEERREIAERGRARVLRDHTYTQRLREMLSTIYSARFEQLKVRYDQSPWARMLSRSKGHPELYERCRVAFERGEEPGLDGLVSDIITGAGKLSETEQKLLFLYHIRKQIINMTREEMGVAK